MRFEFIIFPACTAFLGWTLYKAIPLLLAEPMTFMILVCWALALYALAGFIIFLIMTLGIFGILG